MSFIKAEKLQHKFIIRDDQGKESEPILALDGVDLSVEVGSFIAVLGHNGSGKSTFAKHINALLQPTGGTLYVDGNDTSDEANIWNLRQTAGMVFQNPDNQIVAGVVEEDVAFGLENIGIPSDEIRRRAEEALSLVGMQDYKNASPNKLSGGQKQRVAVAGVIAMKPKCIIMDESTAMLDPSGRAEVLKTVHQLNKEHGVTVIWITHYMEEVVDADRVYVMDSGKIILDGTPKEVFSQVEFLRSHGLNVPQITQLSYELKQEGLALPEGILTVQELAGEIQKIFMERSNHGPVI